MVPNGAMATLASGDEDPAVVPPVLAVAAAFGSSVDVYHVIVVEIMFGGFEPPILLLLGLLSDVAVA